jgi:hypothetical protein
MSYSHPLPALTRPALTRDPLSSWPDQTRYPYPGGWLVKPGPHIRETQTRPMIPERVFSAGPENPNRIMDFVSNQTHFLSNPRHFVSNQFYFNSNLIKSQHNIRNWKNKNYKLISINIPSSIFIQNHTKHSIFLSLFKLSFSISHILNFS